MILNPELLKQLRRAVGIGLPNGIGGGKVLVVNEGQGLTGSYGTTPAGRSVLSVADFGEAYKVCCPWCGDARHRLYINHRWGMYDPKISSKNYRFVKCFNQECQKEDGFLDDLKARVMFGSMGINTNYSSKTVESLPVTLMESRGPLPVKPAGDLVHLGRLPKSHQAIRFLELRKLDPKKLSDNFGVGWCEWSPFSEANQRIVVPLKNGSELMAWQARYIGDGTGDCADMYFCPDYRCRHHWKAAVKPVACPKCSLGEPGPRKVSKWYTSPGAKKTQLMLNYENALSWTSLVVIVEGPIDMFRLGNPKKSEEVGPGVAIFGHQLSKYQIEKLLRPWISSGGIVFLMFDEDVWDNTCKQAELLNSCGFEGKVVPVLLPPGKDPGDCEHGELWEFVRRSARAFDVQCPV